MRSGLFEFWQAEYAARGVATFPVRSDKTPHVRNYTKIGLAASARLAASFSDAFGVGLGCRRNKVTVLDVDTTDENVLADALLRHGATPFVVRSGSGNFHAWYQNGGESRLIRPFGDTPIDVLGDGFVIAPPSQMETGSYEIVAGSLDDLARLPPMKGMPPASLGSAHKVSVGRRNKDLFRHCLRGAAHVDSLDDLMEVAMSHNRTEFSEPLPDEEVRRTAMSAWDYEVSGRNYVGMGRLVPVPSAIIRRLAINSPRVLGLYCYLKDQHSGRQNFILAKALADRFGWAPGTFRTTRNALVAEGLIRRVHAGGRGPGDAPIYEFVDE